MTERERRDAEREREDDSLAEELRQPRWPRESCADGIVECLSISWRRLIYSLILQDSGPDGVAAGGWLYSELERAAPPCSIAVLPPDNLFLCLTDRSAAARMRRHAEAVAGDNRRELAAPERALREEKGRAGSEREAAPPHDGPDPGNPLDDLTAQEGDLRTPPTADQAATHARQHGKGGVTHMIQVEIGTVWQETRLSVGGGDVDCCRLAYLDVRCTFLVLLNARAGLYVTDWSAGQELTDQLKTIDENSAGFRALAQAQQTAFRDSLAGLSERGEESAQRSRRATLGSVAAHERAHIVRFQALLDSYFRKTAVRGCAARQTEVPAINLRIVKHLKSLVWALWIATTNRDMKDYPRGFSERAGMMALHGLLNDLPQQPGETDQAYDARHAAHAKGLIDADAAALTAARRGARATSDGLTEHCQELERALDDRAHPFSRAPNQCFAGG